MSTRVDSTKSQYSDSQDYSKTSSKKSHQSDVQDKEESVQGTKADLSKFDEKEIQQAVQNALATNSSAVVLKSGGKTYFFPMSYFSSNQYGSQNAHWADAGEPEAKIIGGEDASQEVQYSWANRNMEGPGGTAQSWENPMGPYGSSGGTGNGAFDFNTWNQNQLWDQLVGSQMRDQVCAEKSKIRKVEGESRVRMRLLMFMIMTGNVLGALRLMVNESEKQNRVINRVMLRNLNRLREIKAKLILRLAAPTVTVSDNSSNPARAAREQNKQAKYTQMISLTTQELGEIGQNEREHQEIISENTRKTNELHEFLAGMTEADGKVMQAIIRMASV